MLWSRRILSCTSCNLVVDHLPHCFQFIELASGLVLLSSPQTDSPPCPAGIVVGLVCCSFVALARHVTTLGERGREGFLGSS